MHPSPHMQQFITQIARRYSLNLGLVCAWRQLELPGYNPLVIEVQGVGYVSVAQHHYNQGSVPVSDPEIVFHVTGDGWYPVQICDALGPRDVATRDGDKWNVDPVGQPEVAVFANKWARTLDHQGWLQRAICTRRGDPHETLIETYAGRLGPIRVTRSDVGLMYVYVPGCGNDEDLAGWIDWVDPLPLVGRVVGYYAVIRAIQRRTSVETVRVGEYAVLTEAIEALIGAAQPDQAQ